MASGIKFRETDPAVSMCKCHWILESCLSIRVEVEIDGFDVCTHLVLVERLTDHFTHDLAYPPSMVSSRSNIEHGFISPRQSSSHF